MLYAGCEWLASESDSAHPWNTFDPKARQCAELIISQRSRNSTSDATVRGREWGFLNQTRDAVDLALITLPLQDGTVFLRGTQQFDAWIWALYEYGMALACKLGVEWQPMQMNRVDADRKERAFMAAMAWLHTVVDELIETADLPVPMLNP
jgi:hypothetical protein